MDTNFGVRFRLYPYNFFDFLCYGRIPKKITNEKIMDKYPKQYPKKASYPYPPASVRFLKKTIHIRPYPIYPRVSGYIHIRCQAWINIKKFSKKISEELSYIITLFLLLLHIYLHIFY